MQVNGAVPRDDRRRVVVVTGGGSGIGAATAAALAEASHVVIADLPGTDLAVVSARVRANGGIPVPRQVDVRDFDAVDSLFQSVVEQFGGVDVLFANAGLDDQSGLDTGDPRRWKRVVDTNLLGVAHCVRAMLPRIGHDVHADIVVNASVSGLTGSAGNAVYAASKWGVVGLARSLREELVRAGSLVRVTLVEPGLVDTPLARSIEVLGPELRAGRALAPEDVARIVSFVVDQPPHVLLHEVRIEPLFPPPAVPVLSTLKRRARRALTR